MKVIDTILPMPLKLAGLLCDLYRQVFYHVGMAPALSVPGAWRALDESRSHSRAGGDSGLVGDAGLAWLAVS